MAEPQKGLDVVLDMMGQQPLVQIYTQITLCYAVPEGSSLPVISSTLEKGLERTAAALPWIAGQIVREKVGDDSSVAVYKIKPLARAPRLVVKDLRGDGSTPTMDEIRRARFPMSMLHEGLLASRKTLPGPIDGPAEVLSVQAVFVSGGLLLTFTGAHSAMDMMGQGQLIDLICKACRGEDFSPEEVDSGNLPREGLVPLLDEYTPGPELENQIVKPREPAPVDPASTVPPALPPSCRWVCYTFSAKSVGELKEVAMRTLPADSVKFVSADDALTSFVWQTITRARIPRLPTTGSERMVQMTRAVDVRSCLGIPATYPGMMQTVNLHTQPLSKLTTPSALGMVAADLRTALLPAASRSDGEVWDMAMRTRAATTVLARSADKTGISMTAALDLDVDIMLSSWVKLDCYRLDFGLGLGLPEAVVRPRFDNVESLVYLLPRDRAGGVAVAACLRDEDISRLRGDPEFARHAVFVG